MNVQNLLRIGDTMFLERQEVVIREIYAEFHLVEVSCTDTNSEFYVDIKALTSTPNCTYSISIKYFGRSNDE